MFSSNINFFKSIVAVNVCKKEGKNDFQLFAFPLAFFIQSAKKVVHVAIKLKCHQRFCPAATCIYFAGIAKQN